jgi:two-component system, NtrC family, sensor kinase
MRIATTLTLVLLLAVSAVLAVFGYLRMRQERSRVTEELQQEVLILTNAIRLSVEHALRDRQPADIQELLAEIVRDPNPVDRIRIFNPRLEETGSASTDVAAATVVPRTAWDQVLKSAKPYIQYVDTTRRPVVYVILPLKAPDGGIVGGLEVVHVATRVQRQFREASQQLALQMVLLSLTIALVIWLAVRVSIRQPLHALVRAVLAIGRGRLEERMTLARRDEIGQLASAFNRMADELQNARERMRTESQARLELERQLHQEQKLSAVGRLASEVAHEIGTPLSIISGRTEVIQKRFPSDHPLVRDAATVLRQVERIHSIIRQLLDYARPRRPTPRPVPVEPILTRVVDLLEPLAARRQVRLGAHVPPAVAPLLADPDQLQQVLLNLVTNALDATPADGKVWLSAADDHPSPSSPAPDARPHISRGQAATPCVILQIEDTGCGIPPDRLEKIFEPFFSTKERRGGTGLGMAIVEDIVRVHRGAIEIESAEGHGTTIRLRWPAASAEQAVTGDGAPAAPSPGVTEGA